MESNRLEETLVRKYQCQKQTISPSFLKKAKDSECYQWSLKRDYNPDGAHHDGVALYYVQQKRGGYIGNFDEVACWFVTDSKSTGKLRSPKDNRFYEQIRAEHLLSVLWMSSPSIGKSSTIKLGLSRSVAASLYSKMPSGRIVRELDSNIKRYAEKQIGEKDLLFIGSGLAQSSISEVEDLNMSAKRSPADFRERLLEMARKEREKAEAEKEREKRKYQELEEEKRKLKIDLLASEMMKEVPKIETGKGTEEWKEYFAGKEEMLNVERKARARRFRIGIQIVLTVTTIALGTWTLWSLTWGRLKPYSEQFGNWITIIGIVLWAIVIIVPWIKPKTLWSRVERAIERKVGNRPETLERLVTEVKERLSEKSE